MVPNAPWVERTPHWGGPHARPATPRRAPSWVRPWQSLPTAPDIARADRPLKLPAPRPVLRLRLAFGVEDLLQGWNRCQTGTLYSRPALVQLHRRQRLAEESLGLVRP